MKITKVTVQKKNKNRLNVFIDQGNGEEFAFAIDEEVYVKSGIRKGMELSKDKYEQMQNENELSKGLNQALNYLSYRMRSVSEVSDYLRKKDLDPDSIKAILDRLHDAGYTDDLAFAKMFIRNKVSTSHKGPKAIEVDLRQKGVKQSVIEQAIAVYPEEKQLDVATNFVTKKVKQNKTLSEAARKQKMAQALQQKGFSWSVTKLAIEKAFNTSDEDHEREALAIQAEKAARKYEKFSGWEYNQRIKQHLYRKGFPLEMIQDWLSSK